MTTADAVAVPDRLDDALSPQWLTAALGRRYPGIEVAALTRGPVISRVSTNARFTIECAGELPDGLSPHLCVKGYFTEVGWAFRHAGEPEAYFYRDIAASSGMRTLDAVYADVDPVTRHGVVITRDVAADGAVFLDVLSDYSVDDAADSLGQLAALHAATWESDALASQHWLDPRLAEYLQARGVPDIEVNFDGPIGAGVPAQVRHAQRLVDAYAALARLVPEAQPWSVVHGDSHLGNVYRDAAGRPSFCDWQLVQRAPWWLDVGYHLASVLPVEQRRAGEQDLVAHYLDELTARGVPRPADPWTGLRRGMLHGFFLWAITLKVDPPITTELLTRLGTAAADHDVFASVG